MSVFGAFLVRIFAHSDWIRRYTPCLFVSKPNADENGREKLQTDTFDVKYGPFDESKL